jgi:hypothetical protein
MFMQTLFGVIVLNIINGFSLLENFHHPTVPKVLVPCDDMHRSVLDMIHDISEHVPGFFIGDHMNNSGYICDTDVGHFATTSIYENGSITDITVNRVLLNYPNTLYNVLLHEVLHSMGLGHSDAGNGIMNYSITIMYSIREDDRRLWLSLDDMLGLLYLSNLYQI